MLTSTDASDVCSRMRGRAISATHPKLPPPIYAHALHSYVGEPGKLSFKAGDTVKILDQRADGWWVAEIAGIVGFLPAQLVQVEDKKQAAHPGRVLTRGSSMPRLTGCMTFENDALFGATSPRETPTPAEASARSSDKRAELSGSSNNLKKKAIKPSLHNSDASRGAPTVSINIDKSSASVAASLSATSPSAVSSSPPTKQPSPDKPLLTSTTYKAVLSKSSPLLVLQPLAEGQNIELLTTSHPISLQPGGQAGNLMAAGSMAFVGAVHVVKQGYLLKKGHKRRNWTKRWFILRADRKLRYLASAGDKTVRGDVFLTSDTLVSRAQGLKNAQSHPYCMQIVLSGTMNRHTIYYLDAPSPEEMILWIQALQRVIKANNQEG